MTTKAEMRLERRQRALLFAGMIRDGFSLRAIASLQGCSYERVRQVLACGCPDFIQQTAHKSTPNPTPVPTLRPVRRQAWVVNPEPPEPEPRPAWSYPDAVTLALVAQIRREMGQPQ